MWLSAATSPSPTGNRNVRVHGSNVSRRESNISECTHPVLPHHPRAPVAGAFKGKAHFRRSLSEHALTQGVPIPPPLLPKPEPPSPRGSCLSIFGSEDGHGLDGSDDELRSTMKLPVPVPKGYGTHYASRSPHTTEVHKLSLDLPVPEDPEGTFRTLQGWTLDLFRQTLASQRQVEQDRAQLVLEIRRLQMRLSKRGGKEGDQEHIFQQPPHIPEGADHDDSEEIPTTTTSITSDLLATASAGGVAGGRTASFDTFRPLVAVVPSDGEVVAVKFGEDTDCTRDEDSEGPGGGVYEVHRVWLKMKQNIASSGALPGTRRFPSTSSAAPQGAELNHPSPVRPVEPLADAGPVPWYESPRFVLNPTSVKRALWDILSLLMIVYDIVTIPLDFFDMDPSPFTLACSWFTRIAWSLDMPLSMCTGYTLDTGAVEMRFAKIARRYLRSWFVIDATVVGVDWMSIALSTASGVGYARLGKASRTLRVMRMVRLLRVARLQAVYAVIAERISSEKIVVMVNIFKNVVILLAAAHVVGCVWYGISGGTNAEEDSWVVVYGYDHQDTAHCYAISLHWSLSNLQGGLGEITPENLAERFYAICCILFFFVASVIFVSNLTSSMTQLHIIGSSETQRFAILRQYLSQNNISKQLQMRIMRNARHSMLEEKRLMPESRVELLGMVSEPLRAEIHFEVYSPVLRQHTWFARCVEECKGMMHRVCHTAASITAVSKGDVVFRSGDIPSPPMVYVVTAGIFTYFSGFLEEASEVAEKQWVAEPTMWTKWVHAGDFVATTDARLFTLHVGYFQEILSQYDYLSVDPYTYARRYVDALSSAKEPPTDLFRLSARLLRDRGHHGASLFSPRHSVNEGGGARLEVPGKTEPHG